MPRPYILKHLIEASSKENSASDSADCNETILISESNILLTFQNMEVLPAKSTSVTGTKLDKFTNVIANPFLYIKNSSLYVIPMVCLFPEKELNINIAILKND